RGDVEPGALIGGALADIGVAVGAQHVDRSGDRLAVWALSRNQNISELYFVADPEHEPHRSAIVEEAHALTVAQIARAGLFGVENATGRTLAPAQKRHAGKSSVALEIAGRGQETQWPARCLPLFLEVGLPIRHRRQTLRGERLRIELQLS